MSGSYITDDMVRIYSVDWYVTNKLMVEVQGGERTETPVWIKWSRVHSWSSSTVGAPWSVGCVANTDIILFLMQMPDTFDVLISRQTVAVLPVYSSQLLSEE